MNMEQRTVQQIMKKINAPSVEYILNFEKEWDEVVALVKRSKCDLSKIPIVKR